MTRGFLVRLFQPEDSNEVQELYSRMGSPYAPEHAAEVAAMHERAERARRSGTRWSPLPGSERVVSEADHLKFWVARDVRIVGTVGLRLVGDSATASIDTFEKSQLESVVSSDVGEVRRLRVAPECRRLGVATALMQELIDWSTSYGLRGLVLNTTSAQIPALRLYEKLGFRDIGRSYIGSFELIWMRLWLPKAACLPRL